MFQFQYRSRRSVTKLQYEYLSTIYKTDSYKSVWIGTKKGIQFIIKEHKCFTRLIIKII